MNHVELRARIANLKVTLPAVSTSKVYSSVMQAGELVWIAGQIGHATEPTGQLAQIAVNKCNSSPQAAQSAVDKNAPGYFGRLGQELDIKAGQRAAVSAGLGLLSQIDALLHDQHLALSSLLQLRVFVASTAEFTQHSEVAHACSELLLDVLGPAGKHVRTTIGVTSLPCGAAVEVDAVLAVSSQVANDSVDVSCLK